MTNRIKCCIEECRRSFNRQPSDREDAEIMCGRCWRTADARLIVRYNALRARWRRAERLSRRKAINRKPRYVRQESALFGGLFGRAFASNWAALKEDVKIKSAMRVDGTAGELAARRAGR